MVAASAIHGRSRRSAEPRRVGQSERGQFTGRTLSVTNNPGAIVRLSEER
jgi:hypothetical protein